MRRSSVLAAAAMAVAAIAGFAPAAWAHVTVNPNEAPKGGFTKISFRVPNERDNSGTTKLEVSFPPDHPIASVSVRPLPGWTYTVTNEKLAQPIKSDDGDVTEAVSKITWTGGPIKPGEFQEFDVSLGPLPTDVDQLVFKALQTYASGEVVRWIEEAQPGAAEPANPAPVLKLTAASSTGTDTASTTSTMPPPAAVQKGQVPAADAASRHDVESARRFGVIGIILGAIGLLAGIAAFARGRRPARA
jgi:uncharacterized protein YcnI